MPSNPTTMILLFSYLCKHFKSKNSEDEVETFHSHMKALNVDDLSCSFCGAKHSLTFFTRYKRHLVTYQDGVALDNIIYVSRYNCSSCSHTHAILPSVIIPYMSFSFHFTISIIYDYLVGTFGSVESMCEHYGLAITSFYRILKRFKEHKKLWLGLMEDAIKSDLEFVITISKSSFLDNEVFLSQFLSKVGLSFLQINFKVGVT